MVNTGKRRNSKYEAIMNNIMNIVIMIVIAEKLKLP